MKRLNWNANKFSSHEVWMEYYTCCHIADSRWSILYMWLQHTIYCWTHVHAPWNRHLCRHRGPHKTLSHHFSSVYWNNPHQEHLVESEHSFMSTLGPSRKVRENGGWGYIATVYTCSKTQNFIRYADVHQIKLAQHWPQIFWTLPYLNRTHLTKFPFVPDVCDTCF